MLSINQWLAGTMCVLRLLVALVPSHAQNEQAKAVIALTAEVDGFTQPTEFNKTKYPFKYTGTSALDAGQLNSLATAGEVPAATAKALFACLLWPEADDTLENAVLKSDGKKLSGEVEVLHNYGKQGTHKIKLSVDGRIENGRLSLNAVNPAVSGTWSYGKGTIKLAGETKITFSAKGKE